MVLAPVSIRQSPPSVAEEIAASNESEDKPFEFKNASIDSLSGSYPVNPRYLE